MNLKGVRLERESPSLDSLILELKDMRKEKTTVMPGWMTGLPFDLKFPALSVASFRSDIAVRGGILQLKSLNLQSNWILMDMHGEIDMEARERIKSLEGSVNLSHLGHGIVKDYLPIISNQQLSSEDKHFTFKSDSCFL